MSESMNAFLSKESISMHKEYLKCQSLKYSILEKSVPRIKGYDMNSIYTMSISRDVKEEAIRLKKEIYLHECYFDSFSYNSLVSKAVNAYYSSDADFRYRLFRMACERDSGFVCISLDKRGVPIIYAESKSNSTLFKADPVLALDICEHSYFFDYGFNREEYFKRAISYLNLSKLDNMSLDNSKQK